MLNEGLRTFVILFYYSSGYGSGFATAKSYGSATLLEQPFTSNNFSFNTVFTTAKSLVIDKHTTRSAGDTALSSIIISMVASPTNC
jgi:hypothetical protein